MLVFKLFFVTIIAATLALPLLDDIQPLEVDSGLTNENLDSLLSTTGGSLIREKRQFNRRQGFGGGRGRYPGGGGGRYPGAGGGYPGGFGGGFGGGAPSFSSSAANAQAQGFNAGNFGANAAGANTQSFSAGPNGIQGSAGQSFSQNYRFPGYDINVAGAQSFGVGPNGVTRGGSSALTVNGRPFTG